MKLSNKLSDRFRGFLPVVVDVETSGLNPQTDALLEIAAVLLDMDDQGKIHRTETLAYHVEAFPGANIDKAAMEINKIDPDHPFRMAIPEEHALKHIFERVSEAVKQVNCQRAVLVGHNSAFDLSFLQAAVERCGMKKTPFHKFTSFDTATLSAAYLGETVLAKSVKKAGIEFDDAQAHSAIYDTERTADLFCHIINSIVS